MEAFQSTHPVRGATLRPRCPVLSIPYFNPRTPCGVRLFHHPAPTLGCYFNPRTPCGVRPHCSPPNKSSLPISIHAPRAGCDATSMTTRNCWRNFNPRTPCGVRLSVFLVSVTISRISIHAPRAGCDFTCGSQGEAEYIFQSTHPVRGATCSPPQNCNL